MTNTLIGGNRRGGIMEEIEKVIKAISDAEKVKQFLSRLGETGKIADKVSDLILFHNRVRENAQKRYM